MSDDRKNAYDEMVNNDNKLLKVIASLLDLGEDPERISKTIKHEFESHFGELDKSEVELFTEHAKLLAERLKLAAEYMCESGIRPT